MVIRVRKQDSAYFYQILESYEGVTSYSTITSDRQLAYRDIRLHVPPGLRAEAEALLQRLAAEIPLERREE